MALLVTPWRRLGKRAGQTRLQTLTELILTKRSAFVMRACNKRVKKRLWGRSLPTAAAE
jgi:hypothetical protein